MGFTTTKFVAEFRSLDVRRCGRVLGLCSSVSVAAGSIAALALIVTAQFMVILDVAIVNVALPSIQTDLDFSPANLQWVISAYAIIFGGTLLLGGRLADLLGRRRLFMAGLAVFSVSSLLCGLAWNIAVLDVEGGAKPA